jgi:hypothetical protein
LSTKLRPEVLLSFKSRDVAHYAAARAGISSAGCVKAIQECGIKAKNYKKDWVEDGLRSRLSPNEYFAGNVEHMNRIIAALLAIKAEAESSSE